MHLVGEVPISSLKLPVIVAIAVLAALGYMVSHVRSGKTEFTVIDAIIVAIVVTILGAAGVPLLEKANQHAAESALAQNLRTLRVRIEMYKVEHGGRTPVLYQSTLPQLIRATDAEGRPGPPDKKHPFGPYFRSGMAVNPITGRSIVTATDTFPPEAASGNGGWIYHQRTGQVAPDLPGHLKD